MPLATFHGISALTPPLKPVHGIPASYSTATPLPMKCLSATTPICAAQMIGNIIGTRLLMPTPAPIWPLTLLTQGATGWNKKAIGPPLTDE